MVLAISGILCLGLITTWAGPRKSSAPSKTASPDRSLGRAPAETVYVPVAPVANPAPLFASSPSPARDTDERRTRAAFSSGPTRDFAQSYGLYGGFYNAEVLGSNPYANLFWDLFPGDQAYFFEFTSGVGTVQSAFSKSVVGGGVFPHSYMITAEALGGYTYSGLNHGPGRAGGLFPYFTGGITAIYQGGVPNIGAVIGFGNRMNLPFGPKDGRWALNYGLRDHIYSQKIRTRPSMTQNFVLLIGVQKYY
jgi:hypothetical protein